MFHSSEVAVSCPYVAYVSEKKIRYKNEAVNISYNLIQIFEITSFKNHIDRKINASLLFTQARARAHTHTHIHRFCNLYNFRTVCTCNIGVQMVNIPLETNETTRRFAILFRLCFRRSKRSIVQNLTIFSYRRFMAS
jgi:hypothetical protein